MLRIKDGVKMFKETNESNIEGIKKILPYFFLNDDSNKLVLDSLDNRNETLKEGDTFLNLGDDLRAIYELDSEEVENTEGWRRYHHVIDHRVDCDYYDYLNSKEVYKTGKVTPPGKNHEVKLFKYLKKLGVSQEDIEYITTAKAPDKQYLVISRNPTDYLFCATNQSFSSCLSLNSDYDLSLYMTLPATFTDNSRFMVYTTTGKLKRYMVKGHEFKHFNMTSRAWGILLEDSGLYIDKYYPHKVNDFKSIINDAGIIDGVCTQNADTLQYSRYYSPQIKNCMGHRTHIYMDKLSIIAHKNNTYSYRLEYDFDENEHDYEGVTGTDYNRHRYSYHNGFENLDDKGCLGMPDSECSCCGKAAHTHDLDERDGVMVCNSCMAQTHFSCACCGNWIVNGEGNENSSGSSVCNRCASEFYTPCVDCGTLTYTRHSNDTKEGKLCSECFHNKYTTCTCCLNYMPNGEVLKDYRGHSICIKCAHTHHELCDECNILILESVRSRENTCPGCNSNIRRSTLHEYTRTDTGYVEEYIPPPTGRRSLGEWQTYPTYPRPERVEPSRGSNEMSERARRLFVQELDTMESLYDLRRMI